MTHTNQATARSGAKALIEALDAQGVTTIYGVPGEETTALMAAIGESGLTFVLCRHEQSAAFMASVYGRLTGKPAVCLATLGPGATNLVTGVADAQLDHVPLIAITGQGARARLSRESHQIIDLEALFAPVAKLSRTVLDADDIPASTAEAWRLACEEKPGAVHLCLPEDVAAKETDAPICPSSVLPAPLVPDASLEAIGQQLRGAERPVIVAGAGVLRANAAAEIRRFAERHSISVATTFMAKGILPKDHPQMLFTLGQPEPDVTDHALSAADLVLAVGFDPVEFDALTLTEDGARLAALGLRPTPVDSGWQLAAEAAGDIAAALEDLSRALDGQTWPMVPTFDAARQGLVSELGRRQTKSDRGPVAPADLCAAISGAIGEEDIVLSGVGLHKLWIARHVMAKRPGQVIVPNGLAGMGLALPGAIAAAQISEQGRVLAVCGDGDVMMNVQEMETASRLGLRLTVMVWVDGGYGLIDDHQGDSHADFKFNAPLWAKLAQSFGWTHAHIEGVADVPGLLRAGLTAEGSTLLTVDVDYAASGGLPTRKMVA
ncbi:acetolactate synthase large subunit [Primorskyibacter sp. S187A]|uniref:acetolactate synthase large subunit n=1 Tax=Primorskyibacter sp. S187A TaxID=3415130 RepID=UPI003C7C6C58